MEIQNKRNTRIVRLYRYFYPTLIPSTKPRQEESSVLVEKCLIVEEMRVRKKMPIFSLFTQSALAKELSARES
jgi:hypothetical protein